MSVLRLFAYGTLVDARIAAPLLDIVDAEAGVLDGFRLYDSGKGWPFVSIGQEGELVHGQVLTLVGDADSPDNVKAAFAKADRYEGFEPEDQAHSLFVRERTKVRTEKNQFAQAYVYLSSADWIEKGYPGTVCTRIESGAWPEK